MTKRALLVGCNYPGSSRELRGCVNDVHRMSDLLVGTFGFEEQHIHMLTDLDEDETKSPTGVEIKHQLRRLVERSEDGDVLFFHFSGHGARIPPADDEDEYEEAIVPTDKNKITNKDLRRICKNLADGVLFTLVSDSCHSGGLVDFEPIVVGTDEDGSEGEETRSRDLESDQVIVREKHIPLEVMQADLEEMSGHPVPEETIRATLYELFGEDSSASVKASVKRINQRIEDEEDDDTGNLTRSFLQAKLDDDEVDNDEFLGAARSFDPEEDDVVDATAVMVSGCEAEQTSADIHGDESDPTTAYGVLTDAILHIVEKREGNVTNVDLVNAVRKLIKRGGHKQRPCLYCSDDASTNNFICDQDADNPGQWAHWTNC